MQSPLVFALIGRGRMGTLIASILKAELNAEYLFIHSQSKEKEWQACRCADIFIDFSTASAVSRTCQRACEFKKPLLLGTTGWEEESTSLKKMVTKAQIPFLYSPNFSWGIYALRCALQHINALKSVLPIEDISIKETHHQNKIDSPSGTAKSLAMEAKKLFNIGDIAIDSQRYGDILGHHLLTLNGQDETIELSHTAKNRLAFAKGAVSASLWLIAQQPGFFTMQDMANQITGKQFSSTSWFG